MNYSETLEYFEHLEIRGIKFGLGNTKKLLYLSGNPEQNLHFVHVAGTNGKGSTSKFIAEILKAAGYRVGLYTSPHLNRFEERIMINDDCISKECLIDLASYYRGLIEREDDFSPTYFELTTAIALKFFSDQKPDICIMEVGLGGRLDATNVIAPEVAVITGISQDHVQFLGRSMSDIAMEKFSIIKPAVDVVASITQKVIREKLKELCRRNENHLMLVGEDVEYNLLSASLEGQEFTLKTSGGIIGPFKIKMLGPHQLSNAALAFLGVGMLSKRGFNIDSRHIIEGMERARWPGRFEIIRHRPYIVLDGAHNLNAIKKLKETIKYFFPDNGIIFILGIMADKDWGHMIREVAILASAIFTFRIESERACPSEVLAKEARKFASNVTTCNSIKEAIYLALEKAAQEDIICITGSLYGVGEAKRFLERQCKTIPS